MDLRLARLQGLGNLGHGDQIEIDPDRIENYHQKSAQQENRHGCSITEWRADACQITATGEQWRGQGGDKASNAARRNGGNYMGAQRPHLVKRWRSVHSNQEILY